METVFVRSGFRHAFKPNYIVKRNGFVFIIVEASGFSVCSNISPANSFTSCFPICVFLISFSSLIALATTFIQQDESYNCLIADLRGKAFWLRTGC